MDRPPPDAPPPQHTDAPGEGPPSRHSPTGGFRISARRTPISTFCAVVIIAIFVLALVVQGQAASPELREAVSRLLGPAIASEEAVWSGAWWTPVTTAFVHLQPMHFAFNLLAHWGLGRLLELSIPRVQFLLLIVVGAWASTAAQLAVGSGAGVVGFSGVVYAMLGYGWLGAKRDPWLARFFTRETMTVPLLWLVGCVVATRMGWANIANTAHVVGLGFGGLLGMAFAWPGWRARGLALAGLLAVGATVPLVYAPWSPIWSLTRVEAAIDRKDQAGAERWLDRSLEKGLDPVRGAAIRVQVRHAAGDAQGKQAAMEELRRLSPDLAAALEESFARQPQRVR